MPFWPKRIDAFGKNILIVFAGSSLVNICNLLYQLLVAHKLSGPEFAAFNSLLSLFLLLASPLVTLQLAITKFIARFHARQEKEKVILLLSGLFKKAAVACGLTILIFLWLGPRLAAVLKVSSAGAVFLVGLMVASAYFSAVMSGGLQGLEVFGWFSAAAVSSSAIKLVLTFLLVSLGYSICGALAAHFLSGVAVLAIIYFPLRLFIRLKAPRAEVNYKEMLFFLFPVAAANFAFTALVSSDMILVKLFFSPDEAGIYSLAQMLGKIFLFLPGAVSMALFPRASAMTAQNQNTRAILRRSLLYTFLFCAFAVAAYNLFPGPALGLLTGKSPEASIALGRIFSVSMSLYALVYVLLAYFLSLSDMRFVWYLVVAALLQCAGIILYHPSLFAVQALICLNSLLLFISGAYLAFRGKR